MTGTSVRSKLLKRARTVPLPQALVRRAYGLQRVIVARRDPQLGRLLKATDTRTFLSQRKRITLYRAARQARDLDASGCFAEFGVHRGGGAGMISPAALFGRRDLHLFDRWGDLPSGAPQDGVEGVDFPVQDVAAVLDHDLCGDVESFLVGDLEFPRDSLHLHQGWFSETLPKYEGGRIVFAHVDGDFYESTRTVLEFLDGAMTERAIIVLDDFGDWPGVEKAFEEYRATTDRRLDLRVARGQAIVGVGLRL